MSEEKQFASDCEILSIPIWKVGEDNGKPHANLMGIAASFRYYEDVLWPSYGGSIVVMDTGMNLISTMPIQGFEKVVFNVRMSGEEKSYNFRVWSVTNRIVLDRKQSYTLNLISEEGLVNEGVRVNNIREGKTSDVVKKIIQEFFNVEMKDEQVDESVTSIKILPAKKSPYSLIRSLQTKTVSLPVVPTQTSKTISKPDDKKVESSHVGKNVDSAKGSAGYYFYQNYNGFNFKSIDVLANQKPTNTGDNPYFYGSGKTEYESTMKIQEIQYGTEINMMKNLREGSYSSLVCFFNINTGKYNERLFSLKDTWDNMVHLGNEEKELPYGQSELSSRPTRIMSTVVNHENWNMGDGIADSEDPNRDTKFEYTDNQMDYLSQSYARSGIMTTNQLTISLTGHLELVVGDLVNVEVPNNVPDANKETEPFDQEYSGTYLIKKLNHQFDISHQTVYTVLELIRDSTGIRENSTNNDVILY